MRYMSGRSKGISPLIASVLLIAFVMAIGALAMPFFSDTLSGLTSTTSERGDTVAMCSGVTLEVMQLRQEGDGPVRFSFSTNGDETLDNFTARLFNGEGGTVAKQWTGLSLSPGELETVSVSSLDSGPRLNRLVLSSGECGNVQVEESVSLDCPSGFAAISDERGGFCIMKYEASREDATGSSAGTSSVAASQSGVVPWTNVDYPSARNACQAMGSGYNLSTNKQWQAATGAVIGDSSTFVHGNNDYGQANEDSSETCTDDPTRSGDNRCLTGTGPSSWSTSQGVADLNGNVWEWVYVSTGDAQGNVDQSHPMHFGGTDNYVNAWNQTGEYPTSLGSALAKFGDDHYWSSANDNRAVLRGGGWNYGRRAGPFSVDVHLAPSYSNADIGFRCSY